MNSACPADYPFPIDNGLQCCKHFLRKNDTGVDALCDGQHVQETDPVACCARDEIVPCSEKCLKEANADGRRRH